MRKHLVLLSCVVAASLTCYTLANPNVPAFPGAEGYGAFSKGGRGGQVIPVTTLQDYHPLNDAVIPGSLRAAIAAKGPRIIIFRVAGTIELKEVLDIVEPYCTIAGQSAPGGGICLKNYQLGIKTHDVIIRYLRVRPGPGPHFDYEHHAIETNRCRNVILDHCSLTWGTDETLTFSRSSDSTVQWCILGQGLNISTHAEGAHSKTTMVAHGSTRVTYHHNLLVHSYDRNPRIHSLPRDQVDELILNDFRNNVIYNASEADVNGRLNFVGNLYLPGPNFRDMYCVNTLRPNQIYLRDNLGPRRTSSDLPERAALRETDPVTLVNEPFDTPKVATQPASEILEPILVKAGATLPLRDSVDSRIVQDVRERTGKIIDHPNQVGGWPVLAAGEPYPDINNNGMCDEWERRHGLDLGDPASGNNDPDGDGYTNIEEFLNGTNPNVSDRS
jgi:pectate lyase